MTLLTDITIDQLMLSFLACYVIREMMIMFLPDAVAGPGGWLVDTGVEG